MPALHKNEWRVNWAIIFATEGNILANSSELRDVYTSNKAATVLFF